jgi:hypothetical protein
MDARSWVTLVLFALTYLALAAGKVPLLTLLTLLMGVAWLALVPYGSRLDDFRER